ncbi:MAG: hypothetical protein MJA30_22680 [Cytophagales bacterium]|nr:hypothetical protein [Cytophagales bacterium]
MIVGGTAVNVHGFHRLSSNLPKDLIYDFDIWYKPTIENFENVKNALVEIQPENKSIIEPIIFHPERAYIRITEKPFKIEMLPNISGFERRQYSQVRQRAISFKLNNYTAIVISYDDLILSKESLNREVDQFDILELKKIKDQDRDQGQSL